MEKLETLYIYIELWSKNYNDLVKFSLGYIFLHKNVVETTQNENY